MGIVVGVVWADSQSHTILLIRILRCSLLLAIMFCYFEILMRMKDPSKFVSEEGRLMSLNNLLNKAGYEEYTYSDWVEETISLLRQCTASLHSDDSGQALVSAFNNADIGPAIIQHSRVSKTMSWGTEPYLAAVYHRRLDAHPQGELWALLNWPDCRRVLRFTDKPTSSRDRTSWNERSHRRHHQTRRHCGRDTVPWP